MEMEARLRSKRTPYVFSRLLSLSPSLFRSGFSGMWESLRWVRERERESARVYTRTIRHCPAIISGLQNLPLRRAVLLHSARHRASRAVPSTPSADPSPSLPTFFLALRRRNRCGRISGARNHQFRAGKDRSKKESLAPGLLKQTFCSTKRAARGRPRVCVRSPSRASLASHLFVSRALLRPANERETFSSCFLRRSLVSLGICSPIAILTRDRKAHHVGKPGNVFRRFTVDRV